MACIPHLTHTACSLVTESAMAISCGIAPNGRPLKSISKPAIITRTPVSASVAQTSGRWLSKNWASSIPTTRMWPLKGKMAVAFSTAFEGMELRLCDTKALLSYLVSATGLNISTLILAIRARFTRLISSSVLPENIDPQITSILPPNSFRLLKTSSVYNMLNFCERLISEFYSIFDKHFPNI